MILKVSVIKLLSSKILCKKFYNHLTYQGCLENLNLEFEKLKKNIKFLTIFKYEVVNIDMTCKTNHIHKIFCNHHNFLNFKTHPKLLYSMFLMLLYYLTQF